MKVSDIYGKPKTKPAPKPEPKQPVQSLVAASMLCRQGVHIFLNHQWGPGWVCRRCQGLADIKGLLSK